MSRRVCAWLEALARGGCTVLIGDPSRAYLPASGLAHLADYLVPTSVELEGRQKMNTTVYRVTGE